MTTATAHEGQHLKALDEAQRVRLSRAGLRRDLKELARPEAKAVVADVIETCRPEFERMRVDELLLKLGKSLAIRLLTAAQVAPFRTIGELTDRQRTLLCALLRKAGEE